MSVPPDLAFQQTANAGVGHPSIVAQSKATFEFFSGGFSNG
jgi:hypothetical protein